MRSLLRFIPLLLLVALVQSAQGQSFQDATARILSTPAPTAPIGLTVADLNGDGRTDIYHPGRLLLQTEEGTWVNALLGSAIDVEGNAPLIGLPGDPNSDGLTDLLLLDGGPGSRYYENTNTIRYRLANGERTLNIRTLSTGAIWGDFDGGGGIDLFVASSDGQNRLYVSNADGSFTDVSDVKRSGTRSGGCGMAVADWDHDLDLDVYLPVCQGNPANILLEYDSVRDRYTENAARRGVASFRYSHSAVWLDYDNDGWQDLFVVNARLEVENGRNQLYRNMQGTGFEDVTASSGLEGSISNLRRGVAAADFDNDGWTDLYVSLDDETRPQLYRNQGDGTFTDIASLVLPPVPATLAFTAADVDDNGWIDLLFGPAEGNVLLANDGENNWTRIVLRTPGVNRRGMGARVTVTAGGIQQTKQMLMGGGNVRHSTDAKLHFGLGEAAVIDQIQIFWADGSVDQLSELEVNKELVIARGGTLNPPPSVFQLGNPVDAALFDTSAAEIDFSWQASTDSTPLTYTASIWGPGTRLRFSGVTGTSLSVDPDILAPNQIYTWSVFADDGLSITPAIGSRVFTFGEDARAVATLTAPALFDFGLDKPSTGQAAFLDLDGDRDLDVFVVGSDGLLTLGGVYSSVDLGVVSTNGGEFVFKGLADTGTSLQPVTEPRLGVGDMDGDGRPDAIVSGLHRDSGSPAVTLYRNLATGISSVTMAVDARFGGPITIEDVDGDGDGDLLLSGSQSASPPYSSTTILYRNDGGAFSQWAVFPGAMFGDASWGDADGDGDLDLALVGDAGDGHPQGAVYRNDGDSFAEISVPGAGLLYSSIDWGDYNGDGLLDLVVTGGEVGPELLEGITRLYRQDAGLRFVEEPSPLPGVLAGSARFGDYENDGDLDILLTGAKSILGELQGGVFRNQEGRFVAELQFQGALAGRMAIGDYNGDGDLDFIVLGRGPDGAGSLLFFINQQVAEPVPSMR
ncbi:MAG: hypothetical protein ACI9W4_000312 [Rhodothermales bacterium]|jgi:hypothetical protein